VVWGGGVRIDQLFFSIGDACCTVVLFPGDLELLVLGLCDAATNSQPYEYLVALRTSTDST
jgi:hypothetical protein